MASAGGAQRLVEFVSEASSAGCNIVLQGATPEVATALTAADDHGVLRGKMAYTEADIPEEMVGNKVAAARSRLVSGVERYTRDARVRYGQLFERLAESQAPHTMFITCCDSRINPALYTSTDPGELFVVRNVGNWIPPFGKDAIPAEGAAIEYAVGVLGVSQVIICGHSSCGAIRAALSSDPLDQFPSVALWLKDLRAGIHARGSFANNDLAARQNVLNQLENVQTYGLVRKRHDEGNLHIAGWFFDVGTGVFEEYSPQTKQFVPLV